MLEWVIMFVTNCGWLESLDQLNLLIQVFWYCFYILFYLMSKRMLTIWTTLFCLIIRVDTHAQSNHLLSCIHKHTLTHLTHTSIHIENQTQLII